MRCLIVYQLRTKEEMYDKCVTEGSFKNLDIIDVERIKTNLRIAEENLITAKETLVKKRWNVTYQMFYDALHLLVDAYLRFDKVKSRNHICLFAYLCVKHPELELNWDFFEKVRTKRNGINYYGTLVIEKDWKEVAIQFNLYINLLKKEIENKLT